jgi:hypothetical protein
MMSNETKGANMKLEAVGTTDERNECDCCGKTGLKRTVVLRDEDGDFRFYGTTCAARALGRKATTRAAAEKAVRAAIVETLEADHVAKLREKLNTADALAVALGWNYKPSERWNVFAATWLKDVGRYRVLERLEGEPRRLLSRLLELS